MKAKLGSSWSSYRKVSIRWKNWSGFKGLHSHGFSIRKLLEDRDTILKLTGKIQKLQNEINCMNDSRDFQDAESVRIGQSHVASQTVFLLPHPDPVGMLSRSLGMPSRKNGPPSIWDTHGISGNVFANPTASSSAPYPQELNPWSSNVSEHTTPHVMGESRTPVQDQRSQSGPSARNSVIPCEGVLFKELWSRPTTTADFRSSFWQIHHASNIRLLEDKIQDRGMYLFTISYGSYVVDHRSGDGWFSGSESFVLCKRNSNAEVLDAKIASALNRIIQNTRFKKKVSLEERKSPKRGPFPSRKTDRLPDLRVLPGHWSQWFRRELCRPIHNCSSKWWYSGIRFEMGWNFYYQWRKSHLMTSCKDCKN